MASTQGKHKPIYAVSMANLSRDAKSKDYNSTDSLKIIKRDALKAARDLGYPERVHTMIRNCKNEAQVSNVMCDARKRYL